jgi:uncharacterized protein YukE
MGSMNETQTQALLAKMRETLARYEALAARSRSRGFQRQAFADEQNVRRMVKAIRNIEKGN